MRRGETLYCWVCLVSWLYNEEELWVSMSVGGCSRLGWAAHLCVCVTHCWNVGEHS